MSGQIDESAKVHMASHEPTYRVAPGGQSPETWVVAEGPIDRPGPAVATGFVTKEAAQAEADRLNALAAAFEAGAGERRDTVLKRMLSQP